jgi:hypothetical protein
MFIERIFGNHGGNSLRPIGTGFESTTGQASALRKGQKVVYELCPLILVDRMGHIGVGSLDSDLASLGGQSVLLRP